MILRHFLFITMVLFSAFSVKAQLCPVAVNDVVIIDNTSPTYVSVLQNDSNTDNINFFTLIDSTVSINASIEGDSILLVPDSIYIGNEFLRYQICNGCGCDTAIVFITVVCSAPIANSDTLEIGFSPDCLDSLNLVENDWFGTNPVLMMITTSAAGNFSLVDSWFYFSADSTLIDSTVFLDYELCDDCNCDTATIAVRIGNYGCNANAPLAVNDAFNACIGEHNLINPLTNDYEIDDQEINLFADSLFFSFGGNPVLNLGTELLFESTDSGQQIDSFHYIICDNGTPVLCDTAMVILNLMACPNPPEVLDDSGAIIYDIMVDFYEGSSQEVCLNILNNHYGNFSLEPAMVSTPFNITIDSNCINFEPISNDYFGLSIIPFELCDNYGHCAMLNFVVNVSNEEDFPIVQDEFAVSTGIDNLQLNLLANDFDPDLDTIVLQEILVPFRYSNSMPNSNGIFTYIRSTPYHGLDTLQYLVCDPNLNCKRAVVYIHVLPVAMDDTVFVDSANQVNLNPLLNDYFTNPQDSLQLCDTNELEAFSIFYMSDSSLIINANKRSVIEQMCYNICITSTFDDSSYCAKANIVMISVDTTEPTPPEGADSFVVYDVITPNGDGFNDKWIIESNLPLNDLEINLFSRWGDLVWKHNGPYQNDFEGLYDNGKPLPDGVYYYVISSESANNLMKNGSLSILR